MAQCKKCKSETDNIYNLVELKTMIVRNFTKSTRYQAMGNVLQEALCPTCLTEYMEKELNYKQKVIRTLVPFALYAAFGLALVLLNLGTLLEVNNFVPKVFGAIVLFTSILGCTRELKKIKLRTTQLNGQKEELTRKHLAVDLLSKLLPQKHNDANLTYIDKDRLMTEDYKKLALYSNSSVDKLKTMRQFLKGQSV